MGYAVAQKQSAGTVRTNGFPAARSAPLHTDGQKRVVALPGIADALLRIGQVTHCRKDGTVYEAGSQADHIFRVTSGTLRVVQLLPDGRRHICSFLNPGDFFGFSEIGEHAVSVEAITEASLLRYPRRQFESILQSHADAGQQIFRLMCHQLSMSNRMLLLLGRKTAAERLASFLRIMADSGDIVRGSQIYLPMSRADIADHLGLTIETVSRTITQFRQQKIIEISDRHQVRILNPEALEEMAGE